METLLFIQAMVFNFNEHNKNFSPSESEYDMPLKSPLICDFSFSLSPFFFFSCNNLFAEETGLLVLMFPTVHFC